MEKKELKFIHITKTAGTSIEDIGKNNNILWGRFHKEYGWWHEPFIRKQESLKNKYNWFAVVRNPYTRIISEFYCEWGTILENKNSISKLDLNKIIKKRILNRKDGWQGERDHYQEQHLYIDKKYNIHILKYENITDDFNNLMQKYSLNIKLDKKVNKNKYDNVHTINSLSPEVIKIINDVYDKDFKMFGYEKISVA